MRVLWRVIVKEFLQLRQDRRMLPMILVAPLVQLVVFGFAVNTDVTDVALVVVDRDRSAESRALVERFVASGYFRLAGTLAGVDAVDPWLIKGRARAALVIGEGFGRAVLSGGSPRVQVLVDGSDSATATVALGYATGLLGARERELMAARLEGLASAGAAVEGARARVQLLPRVFYNPDLKSRWFYVPAVLAMILMIMTMLLSAMGIVREKEIGTLEQIIVTPIAPWQLVVGKLFPFALIGLLQVPLVTALAVFGFGVPLRGSFALLVALTLLFLLNTLGLGLLVSTLVSNQQQAMMVSAFLLMVPMIYLSGLIFPIENMPPAIRLATYAIPLRYYANVIRGIFLRGSGLEVLWPEALVMGAMGLGVLALASLRFRKRLD